MKEILRKYELGEHITDREMQTLLEAYQRVIEATQPFGEVYRLVLNDAVQQSRALDMFAFNRGLKKAKEQEGHSWDVLPATAIDLIVVNRKYDRHTDSFLVPPHHIEARKPVGTKGTYAGVVPGAGGDLFWVSHEDGTVAAYAQTELQPVKE